MARHHQGYPPEGMISSGKALRARAIARHHDIHAGTHEPLSPARHVKLGEAPAGVEEAVAQLSAPLRAGEVSSPWAPAGARRSPPIPLFRRRRPSRWRRRRRAAELGADATQHPNSHRQRVAIVLDDVVEFLEEGRSLLVI